MTDKQHDTQKAAGRASGAHTQKQATGTGRRKGTQQNTAEHSRRHTAATDHTAGGAEDKQKAGRKGGERGADGLAPGEWWRRGSERRHGSREGTERDGKKKSM